MKTKKYRILATIAVSCVSFLSVNVSGISVEEKAQLETYGVSTLRGLKKVVPRIVVLPRTLEDTMEMYIEGKRDELDAASESIRDDLQREMWQLLRRAGIEIVHSSNVAGEHTAYLSIDVTIRKMAKDLPIYAFTVHIQLSQLVRLVRAPKILTNAPTWPNRVSRPNIAFVAEFGQLEKAIRNEVTTQLENFIEDYLAANPKQQPKGEGR